MPDSESNKLFYENQVLRRDLNIMIQRYKRLEKDHKRLEKDHKKLKSDYDQLKKTIRKLVR